MRDDSAHAVVLGHKNDIPYLLAQLPLSVPNLSPDLGQKYSNQMTQSCCFWLSWRRKINDSVVGRDHSLDKRGIAVPFPTWTRRSSLLRRVSADPGAHTAVYSVCTNGSFCGDKAGRWEYYFNSF